MVKISSPFNNIKPYPERNSLELPDPATPQKKDKPIQMRLTKAIVDQLRLYAEEHGITVTTAVESIVTEKFYNKQIIRHFFNLESPSTILLPTSDTLFTLYATDNINMVADVVETSTDTFNIRTFDKQAILFDKFQEELQIMEIHQVSNMFDTYDLENECYYSTYGLNEGENPFLNHAGLIMATGENIFDKKANGDPLTVLIFVSTYNGILREARIITKEEAIKLAENVGNSELKKYLLSIEDEVKKIQHIANVRTRELELMDKITQLQQENEQLKDELATSEAKGTEHLQQRLNELQEENQKMKGTLDHFDEIMASRIESVFDDMLNRAKSTRTVDEILK